jgi:hypothetical protein
MKRSETVTKNGHANGQEREKVMNVGRLVTLEPERSYVLERIMKNFHGTVMFKIERIARFRIYLFPHYYFL